MFEPISSSHPGGARLTEEPPHLHVGENLCQHAFHFLTVRIRLTIVTPLICRPTHHHVPRFPGAQHQLVEIQHPIGKWHQMFMLDVQLLRKRPTALQFAEISYHGLHMTNVTNDCVQMDQDGPCNILLLSRFVWEVG